VVHGLVHGLVPDFWPENRWLTYHRLGHCFSWEHICVQYRLFFFNAMICSCHTMYKKRRRNAEGPRGICNDKTSFY
jgi:hypothetical protein